MTDSPSPSGPPPPRPPTESAGAADRGRGTPDAGGAGASVPPAGAAAPDAAPAPAPAAASPAAPPPEPPLPPPPAADPARRLLTGDRLCTGCGHNLVHQPIVRESTYDLLVVRCPECGVVAPLQEYPLLGRWAGRLAALGAATWAAALLLVLLGAGAGCYAAGMIAWGQHWDRADDWIEAVHRSEPNAPGFRTWFVSQDRGEVHRRVLEVAGPDWSVVGAAVPAVLAAPAAFGAGVLLALLLPHRRALGRLVAAGLTGLIGMALLAWTHRLLDGTGGWSDEAVFLTTGWRVAAVGIGFGTAFVLLGGLLGRPLARGLVLLGVPPRMRGALAFLWLVDGRPPPPGVAVPPRPPRPSPPTASTPEEPETPEVPDESTAPRADPASGAPRS